MYNVAVDVGGTFTDVLVFDEETGEIGRAHV
jgi:N-methylhydantoinase A/oxoprolinase/acetone carboxylase beta subunit